jgi:ABC-type multidrug transport system ATPase subunit/pSer/pThr/pTyr-binding forkhead associated (FHA) protein
MAGGLSEDTILIRSSTTYLSVEDRGRKLSDVRLGQRPLRIGRRPDNDVVVVAPGVAPYHARIEPMGSGHRIVDLENTTGLMFRGTRVPSHVFADGDVIRIGERATGNFVSLVYQDVGKRSQAQQSAPVQRVHLDRDVTTIGREGCDLTLPSLQVSRMHAEVRRAGKGHEVLDLGSTNGTFVGGTRVQQQHRLRVGDVVQVGPFKLTYTGRSLDQLDQVGAMRIDARGLTRKNEAGRVILDQVSLVIEPREFVAIVGPSGSGKSTLMGALAGYRRADRGALQVNGDDFYKNYDCYRGVLGYVPQDDILHANLRVEDALAFTAKLRLPADTTAAEISARIVRVLEEVEMSAHRQQRIVDLSGGERKRVSIASELLADPSLFFLDEPTSGLDPGLEKRMMYTLRYLADSGRTVVLVTHATANIMQCDLVGFMAAGRLVYYGPPAEALLMFGANGDFADIYTRLHGRASEEYTGAGGELAAEYAVWCKHHPGATAAPMMAELWEIRYRKSKHYQTYVYERQQARGRPADSETSGIGVAAFAPGQYRFSVEETPPAIEAPPPVPPSASLIRQLGILTARYVRLLLADRRNLLILLMQAPIIGVVILLASRANALQSPVSSNGRLVLFLLSVIGVWFGVLNSVREVTKEAKIYRRERLANLRIGAYLGSKLVVLAGLCLIQSLVLLAVIAIRVDFTAEFAMLTPDGFVDVVRAPPLGLWGASLVTVFLTTLSGVGLGLLISTTVSSSDKAMSVVPLALIPQLVFALALMPLPAALAPLSYVTGARWGMEGLGSIAHLLEPRDMTTCEVPGDVFSCAAYATVNYDPGTGHILTVWGVLVAYLLICLALTSWSLRRIDRGR